MKIRADSVALHTWVVAYDIEDDARRRRIARILEGEGERIQFSVFECRLDLLEMQRLRARIQERVDAEVDRVRWYPLCGPCLARRIGQGRGRWSARLQREGFLIV